MFWCLCALKFTIILGKYQQVLLLDCVVRTCWLCEKLPSCLPNDCTIVHSHQQWTKVRGVVLSCQYSMLSLSGILAIPIGIYVGLFFFRGILLHTALKLIDRSFSRSMKVKVSYSYTLFLLFELILYSLFYFLKGQYQILRVKKKRWFKNFFLFHSNIFYHTIERMKSLNIENYTLKKILHCL